MVLSLGSRKTKCHVNLFNGIRTRHVTDYACCSLDAEVEESVCLCNVRAMMNSCDTYKFLQTFTTDTSCSCSCVQAAAAAAAAAALQPTEANEASTALVATVAAGAAAGSTLSAPKRQLASVSGAQAGVSASTALVASAHAPGTCALDKDGKPVTLLPVVRHSLTEELHALLRLVTQVWDTWLSRFPLSQM